MSFTAVTILGLVRNWSAEDILEAAGRFAARVCGLRGTVSIDPEFYHTERNHA